MRAGWALSGNAIGTAETPLMATVAATTSMYLSCMADGILWSRFKDGLRSRMRRLLWELADVFRAVCCWTIDEITVHHSSLYIFSPSVKIVVVLETERAELFPTSTSHVSGWFPESDPMRRILNKITYGCKQHTPSVRALKKAISGSREARELFLSTSNFF